MTKWETVRGMIFATHHIQSSGRGRERDRVVQIGHFLQLPLGRLILGNLRLDLSADLIVFALGIPLFRGQVDVIAQLN